MYGYSKLEWLPARVPGHVHLDLIENGIIPDPFQNSYELGVAWVDEEAFVYKTSFEYAPDAALPRALLRFAGLDTVCKVSLNGALLAEHDNMFVALELDVTDKLLVGKNELSIEFESAARVGRERRLAYLRQEGLPDNVVHFEERAFVRKSQYMFGWDWGPRLVSCGVWDRVELVQFSARLLDVQVTQLHLPDGSVELGFHSEIEGSGRVLHWLEGQSEPIFDGTTVRLTEPELWWPAGMGQQRLYSLKTLLLPSSAAVTAGDAQALDRRDTRVGLRTVRLLRRDDALGQSFEFEVNGRPLWAVGANWIPDSSFPASITREQVRRQVERARDMNMNMLRVWGGGLYESEDFYDACDELGLLVWQDFPYGCCYYPDDAPAREVARLEARHAVRRLRNRASLAIYCGNNENLTMFQDKWTDAARHPPRYYGEPIYEQVLADVVRELDPDKPYLPTSPWGGERANGGGVGDQHYWDVWHGRGDWKFYDESTARFCSEFGFASSPGPSQLERMVPSASDVLSLPVRHAAVRWHDKTRKGYETFVGYTELHYARPESLGDWLYLSQLNQRDALRHGIEHFRRSEFCKGSLIWQLNDCWPVQSWAVIDAAGEYKAAAYELRRLYAPALLSIEKVADGVRLWAVLDNVSEPVRGPVRLEARSLSDGSLLQQWEHALDLAPGQRRVVIEAATAAFDPESTLIVASFQGVDTFRLLAEPKRAKLAGAQLRARIDATSITVTSDVPVVDLYLSDAHAPVSFDRNFITLGAAGSVTIGYRGELKELRARSLRGHHTLIMG